MFKRIIKQLMREQLRLHYMQLFVICSAVFSGVFALILLLANNPTDALYAMIVGMVVAAGVLCTVAHLDGG